MNKQILSNSALFLTSLIWGLSFVAQKAGMDYLEPFSFNFARCILGGLSLIPLVIMVQKLNKKHKKSAINLDVTELKGGISCGIALFTAMSIQQYCMLNAGAGKAGFISSLYIIFVPLILMFFGHKLAKNIKYSITIALIGLYLLCFKNSTAGFDIYDIFLLIGAFFYGVHIIIVNHFSQKANPVKISCLQFFVVGILSIPLVLLFENPVLQNFIDCKIPILFAGILTCGVAYTLQIFGQKNTPPAIASLILCMESVFAVIGGSIILGETMTVREICGCVLMICAIIVSQGLFKKEPRQLFQPKEVSTDNFDR